MVSNPQRALCSTGENMPELTPTEHMLESKLDGFTPSDMLVLSRFFAVLEPAIRNILMASEGENYPRQRISASAMKRNGTDMRMDP